MEKFLFDLNEILASNLGIAPSSIFTLVVLSLSVLIGISSLFLALRSIIKLLSKKPVVVREEPHLEAPTPKEINIEIGEFGKITSDKKVTIKGQELDYFIIKKSKYDKDSLPVGTIVVIIKKNANEAYVKPADDKDKVRLKGLL
jgi:hypothetical protein